MVKKKYAGEKEIRDKIKELFSYRKLTDLLHEAQLDQDRKFVDLLTEVQYQIYLLDAYLESEWILDPDTLNNHWEQIEGALRKLVPGPEKLRPLLSEIRDYERIELNCRKQKWPTREPFKKFYTIKSCDVRLIRHLIYRASPALQETWKEKAWAGYDLITEINDDIADLHEDLPTYNGNRFLIAILKKGILKTSSRYREQLHSISESAEKYFRKHTHEGAHDRLYEWTMSRAAETLDLLEARCKYTDQAVYTSSFILAKME